MNKPEPGDFCIDAGISSKLKNSPGVLFLAPCAEIVSFGNMSIHTSNTCESKKIIIGRNSNRSMYAEYQNFFLDTRKKMDSSTNQSSEMVVNKMSWFIDTLEKFMTKLNDFLVENENRRSGLTRVIYPSNGGVLEDLKENLIGKMKPWALSSSGKDDSDTVDLVKDDKGMNVAKLNGAEKLNYENGSGLVSWMPTGNRLQVLTKNLNSLLGYTLNDLMVRSEYFFSYVLQTFMNVIFVNNPHLSELDRTLIVNNFKILLENISNKNSNQFESYKRAMDKEQKKQEIDKPTRFIKFLLNQICKGTSLQNLDLNEEKYMKPITTITSLLCYAQHPNQVLVEQWHFDTTWTMGDAFCGKNNVLYLPLYKILQRFIGLNLFKFENDGDKTEFEQMLHFMVNLSGKFRFKKTKFDLSSTQTQEKYKFGGQITTEGTYKVSTEYETDISFDYFQNLTQKIIEFEEFEEKIRKADYKFNDNDICKIIECLLNARFFYDDIVEKILKDKDFFNKFIVQAEETKTDYEECCYKSAYEIFVNDYFDLLDQCDCIDKTLLSHANLIKYFNNDKRKTEIVDLDAELVVVLELFDKLDAKTINDFLENENKKSNMLKILKLVIGKIKKEKLNELNFDNFDDDLLNAVVLSRINDIDNNDNKMKKIDFGKLRVDTQKFLFKKMADNNFKDFDLNIHWNQVSIEVFESASIGEWRKFVFEKIPEKARVAKKDVNIFKQRPDILKLMPVNILSLFDTRSDSDYTFFDFFDDCFDCWSAEQILTFGNRPNRGLEGLSTNKMKEEKIMLKENALSMFLHLPDFFQMLDPNIDPDEIKWDPGEILFDFFSKYLSDGSNKDNITECLKYVFSSCESNCLLAMIIMNKFIFSDEEIDKNGVDGKNLLTISQKIKSALNWDNADARKKIIKNLFSFIPKINEFMRECDRIAGGGGGLIDRRPRFITLVNIYKSFLNKILLLYSDDIEKDDVKKIPVYFLDNKEVIKLFCRMCGDRVGIDCFSEIIDSANSASKIGNNIKNDSENMYKFKKASSIFKILDVVDNIEEITNKSSSLDPEGEIYDFMTSIQTTALLICFGYPEEQPGNSIETHLGQYDKKNGKFSGHSNSILRDMFNSLCDKNKKITIDKFLKNYGYQLDENQKTQLEKITSSKENAGNFNSFEELILPLIENDYKGKKMDFAAFVQKYNLLKNAIGVENIDKRMINIAYDCVGEKLSFKDFIYKYYVLSENENKINENKIIDEESDDYHIKELEDETSQNILREILINGKDTKGIIDNAEEEAIKKLYKNLLPKNKNSAKEKKMAKMCDSVKKYLDEIKLFKRSDNKFSGDSTKLAHLLFAEEEYEAETKANKFKTMIDTYTKGNQNNWENFSEIYILQHISLQNMREYMKLWPKYQIILDLNAKAENLENVVKEFYQRIDGIGECVKILSECYKDINRFLEYPFLLDMQKKMTSHDFIGNFKMLLQNLIEISGMYASDEAMKICKKYEYLIKDESGSSIKKFFSSMVNYVHFIIDYRRLAEILEIEDVLDDEEDGDEKKLLETKEKKIGILAYKIFEYQSTRCFSGGNNFAAEFVHCLDKLKEILNLNYEGYKKTKSEGTKEILEDGYKQEQELLKQIYNKYKEYGERFLSPKDIEIMCQERDGISNFQKDFDSVIETLEDIGFRTTKFESCVDMFRNDILKEYKKGFETGTTLEKFVDLGYQKYFSDKQLCNIGVRNIFNSESNDICTPKSVIKKLPKIIDGGSTEKLDKESEKLSLCPGDKLEYIIASGNPSETCSDTMRKLLWHMDHRKLKTLVSDYKFEDFKDKNQTNDRKIAEFGVHLQNILIYAFGYKSFEFKSKKANKKEKDGELKEKIEDKNEKNDLIEYNKISVSQKFIFGECFFGGMFRSICQINNFKKINQEKEKAGRRPLYDDKIYNIDIEKELDELINMLKGRVLSICQNPPTIQQTNKNKLALIKAMPKKKSFDASLEELIARAFLSAHIYAYSGHIDGNEHDKSLLDFENNVFDKIISMLSRSEEHDKFQNIDDIKKWVDESSLKYFIQGTFNFKEIPENELSSHQMELEQNDLIAKYNTRILSHILSKIGDKVSAFEVFEKIYLDDKNKVIYKFDFMKLLDLLSEKVITTAKKKEDFLTLLKFLKKVKIPEKKKEMSEADCDKFFNCLLECAKMQKLLDENKKFVNKEALTWWIENVVLVFAVDVRMNDDFRKKIFMYMADNIGKNISVMDVINILKETVEKNPGSNLASALFWQCDERFVNNLFGQKETQFISAENSKNFDKDKLKNVFCFLDKIGPFGWFDLLNLFPLLDVMNEKEKLISTDIPNGTKKFINEDSLQNFFGYEVMDDAGNEDKKMVIELWKFLYAISRIPEDKTLLYVVKKFGENNKKTIFNGQWECSLKVFENAVKAMYNCLIKEKNNMNEQSNPGYIEFLIKFFTNVGFYGSSEYLKEIGPNVSKMIGDIFNLFQRQELVNHIDDIRTAFSNDENKTSILYSIFCKSIENMGNDDITNGNLLKVLEMLKSLENISESDFNKFKNALNEKIKTVMSNDKDPQKMANDILSIVSVKKISSLLDLSPCFDTLNSENLFVSQNHPITNFIKNGVPEDNKDCDNKWIRFKYAMQRIPKNMTVVNVLQEIKQKQADILNFNFPELPGNLYANDFCKDICSRIQKESNSMPQNNQKLFETVDILIEFFKKITLLEKEDSKIKDCFSKNWDDIVKNKDTNEESFIVSSIIETLKNLLSKYKFNDVNDITVFFSEIKKILKELKLDSKKDAGIDIFIPTVSSALDNSNLNIFLLLEYLQNQKNDDVCKCVLKNKDILNKLSDMFKQQIEKLEKEEIANVEFPGSRYIVKNYQDSGIIFLVGQFVDNGDINKFHSLVHSALRICYCNITTDRAHIKKCKIVDTDENYSGERKQKEQIVTVNDWLDKFWMIFDNVTAKKLTGYHLGILQKMALEYLIDTLGKDIKTFNVLNTLIGKTKSFLKEYEIGANEKVDEFTTLNKEMSKTLVDKILDEKFSEEKKIEKEEEEEEEEKEIKGFKFEAEKKIRFASNFVQLMGFKIDATEEKRLFDELRKQRKEQKLEYEAAEQKKKEERRKREEEQREKEKERKEKEKQNGTNTINNKSNDKNNAKKNNLECKAKQHGNTTGNVINATVGTGNKQNEKTIKTSKTSSTLLKQIEHPINKKNILIKALACFLTLVFVSLCIYFFIQSAIMNAIITLILTIIFVLASILLTIYLPNKKEQDTDKIKIPLNEENDIMYNDFYKYPNQQGQIIEQNKLEGTDKNS